MQENTFCSRTKFLLVELRSHEGILTGTYTVVEGVRDAAALSTHVH
jgi:hypothetical protein